MRALIFLAVIPNLTADALVGYLARDFFNEDAIFAHIMGSLSPFVGALLVTNADDVDGSQC